MKIMSLIITLVATTALIALGQEGTVEEVKHGAKKAGETVKNGLETAGKKTKEAAETVGEKTKETAQTVGRKTKETAQTIGGKTRESTSSSHRKSKKHRGRPRQKTASNNRQIRRLIRQAPPIGRIGLAYSTRALGHVRFRSHRLGHVEPFGFAQDRLRETSLTVLLAVIAETV